MKKSIALLLAGLTLFPTLASCKSDTAPAATTTVQSGASSDPAIPGVPATELDLTEAEKISYYTNPVLSSKKEGYGLGDPFVMRYNGSYYLYITSTGKGIYCWKSDNLVKWSYKGMCAREAAADGGYAPEVFYYNGKFYMYTSPKGDGHYVFVSDSPTGPFKVATGNLGMSIDGSVFIDNDGKWYFYTAGGNGIQAYTMSSPTNMTFAASLSSTSMNGWTEGPMVVYHDGYYYMTYTGNHFQSLTYRINYVTGIRTPLAFTASDENPLLISTDEEIHHIGHNSTFKGPDLDSYYIAYHSMTNDGYNRDVNIDRIVFNGTSVEVMGPTITKQQVPDMPDVYTYFKEGEALDDWTLNGSFGSGSGMSLSAGSSLVSNTHFNGNYTAEYNVASISDGGMAGAVFSYTDTSNFGTCLFDPASQKVIITITVNGESTVKEVDMIQSFKEKVKFDCIQSIQIEKDGDDYTFYMNDRELGKIKDSALAGGGIGYIAVNADATFGFIGATGAVGGQGAADEYKSVSEMNGLIPANTYTSGSFPTETKNKVEAVVAVEGNVLNYRVLASAEASYDLSAEYFTEGKDSSAVMEVYVDGTYITDVALAGSKAFTTAVARGIPLTKGQHTVSFKLKSGNASFTEFYLLKSDAVSTLEIDYSAAKDGNVYTDGGWSIQNGSLSIAGDPATGKRLYGDKNWGDYTVEVEITPGTSINAGVLVRATNPGTTHQSPTYAQGNPSAAEANAGTDWVEGYYIGITKDNVLLAKQSYNYNQLKTAKVSFTGGTTYTLKVVCEGANIKVYVDDTLYIDYTDNQPYTQGMAGVRTYQAATTYDNFKVSAVG
ncbi:MAG: family 43 glycosylhydrolase [Clostridia bacterium]|nr:family 43 glycosylhydrolase [Clostridia bacterium]